MKKVLLVALLAIGVSAASFAQGGGRMTPEQQLANLKTSLSLTDAQAAKITVILAAQTKSQDSLRAAGGDRTAMQPIRTAAQAKIKAVLTADQAKTYDALPQNQRRGPGGGAPGAAPAN